MHLHMQRWGDKGSRILLVHGSVTNGETTWSDQRPLADRWRLLVVDRRGYFPNPPADREDFEVDAADIAKILGSGMHLVGHSYGGVVALLAALARPEAVRSLTVIEPPALGVAPRTAEIQRFSDGARRYWKHGPADPDAFLRGFLKLAGSSAQPPSPLPPPLLQGATLLMAQRSPEEAVIPLDRLRAAPFPKLVVSGAHSAVFDQICDALESGLGAERAIIPGAGHSVPSVGAPFNDRLEAFLRSAEAARGTA
jgi:pimeloyl-ACP methyl ester carboxylesterase